MTIILWIILVVLLVLLVRYRYGPARGKIDTYSSAGLMVICIMVAIARLMT